MAPASTTGREREREREQGTAEWGKIVEYGNEAQRRSLEMLPGKRAAGSDAKQYPSNDSGWQASRWRPFALALAYCHGTLLRCRRPRPRSCALVNLAARRPWHGDFVIYLRSVAAQSQRQTQGQMPASPRSLILTNGPYMVWGATLGEGSSRCCRGGFRARICGLRPVSRAIGPGLEGKNSEIGQNDPMVLREQGPERGLWVVRGEEDAESCTEGVGKFPAAHMQMSRHGKSCQ
ncbi:hypothetical protein C8T65DRAFT_201979 [Cerioporus squamosus]|nr:hypothetical protein C8T65DRAFT_201979 [Cerioporus squamosus]